MIVSLLSAPVSEEIVLETLIIIEPRQISLSTQISRDLVITYPSICTWNKNAWKLNYNSSYKVNIKFN